MKRALILLPLFLLLSCGSESDPTDPGGGAEPPLTILPPDPDGMLLPGEEGDSAAAATVHLAPSPVGSGQIVDRLLTTRLTAVIAPGATVGEVNAALAGHEAAIVSMVAGVPSVTLVVPAVEDRNEAEALADALVAGGAFIHARPGVAAVRIVESRPAGDKDLPESEAAARVPHALPMRLPAAWNLKEAAIDEVELVHPNWYADVPGYIEIPQLSFAPFGIHVPPGSPEYAAGSLGYYMLGVAAANWEYDRDFSPHTGTDPAAEEALSVTGVDNHGLTTDETLAMTALAMPDDPARVVLLDTESFDDPEFEMYRFIDRAWLALQWRQLVHNVMATDGPNFLHVVAAGETRHVNDPFDDAILNSTAGVASLPDLRAVALQDGSQEEYENFVAAYDEAVAQDPVIAEPLSNVLIVGSSDASGNESSFSAPGSHVRVVGEGVVGPCLVGDQCDGVSIAMDNTAAAAAQVAGLACYLWHLDDSLSLDNLLLRLQHAYSASGRPGILDASIAALSVERSGGNVALRELLLDVDGPGGEPDGEFTEHDIEKFLEAFEFFAGAIEPDYSVYDLNGDGWTAGTGGGRMDLDGNDLPSFTTVDQTIAGITVSFQETAVTDAEVLCYYAWSSLYSGDPEVRGELLAECSGATGDVLAGSKAINAFDLDIESESSGEYDDSRGADRVVITEFGEHVSTVDSTIAMGNLRAAISAHASASLQREPGGTITIAVDMLATSRVHWPEGADYASAETENDLHIGLELTGEHTFTVSGRLAVDGIGDEVGAAIYAYVGPDSTIHGWTVPGGSSWRIDETDFEPEFIDISVGPVTIPEGTHRIWLNLKTDTDARDDANGTINSTAESSAAVEELLIVLVPAEPGQSGVRVLGEAGGRSRQGGK